MTSTLLTGIAELFHARGPHRARGARARRRPHRLGRPGRRRAGRRPAPGPRRPRGDPRLRRLPLPPGLRRRPGAGVRGPDGGGAVRRGRHPHHRRRHPCRTRRAAHRPRGAAGRGDAAPGHDHRRDQERLRPHGARRGPQPGGGPAVHRRDDLPRRPRRAHRVRRRPGRLRRPRDRTDAGGRGAARPLGRRLLRDRCLRRRPGPRRARRRGRGRPRGAAARQPARPRARRPAGRRARPGRRRPLHLPLRRRRRRPARRGHDRHPAARRGVLDPAALPRRPAAARRRRAGGAGLRLQPRLLLHQLAAVLHRARGPRDGDDPGGGRHAATAGGAAALDRDDVGVLAPGRRADLVVLDAPSHVHLAYRPGVPLVAQTWLGGRPV